MADQVPFAAPSFAIPFWGAQIGLAQTGSWAVWPTFRPFHPPQIWPKHSCQLPLHLLFPLAMLWPNFSNEFASIFSPHLLQLPMFLSQILLFPSENCLNFRWNSEILAHFRMGFSAFLPISPSNSSDRPSADQLRGPNSQICQSLRSFRAFVQSRGWKRWHREWPIWIWWNPIKTRCIFQKG